MIDSGYKEDDGSDPSPLWGLSTKAEQTRGRLAKEKYHTDHCILGEWDPYDDVTVYPNPFPIDKFPPSACTFYTLPDLENPSCPTYTISSSVAKSLFLVVNVFMRPSSARRV